MGLEKRLIRMLMLLPSVLILGGIGYRLIEGWPWVDAFYMSVITVTTVGFAEVHPLSQAGRVFTSVLILFGVGTIAYAFGAVTDYFVAAELQGFLEERRMNQRINSIDKHFIVCGYGRMGTEVSLELTQQNREVVVIDEHEEVIQDARKGGYLGITGDPGLDSTLMEAGIERAAGLVVASDNDAKNLMVVLSASALRPDLSIIARVSAEEASDKFVRAGAHSVFLPYRTGGRHITQMLLKPEVVGFLDMVMHDQSIELLLESCVVEEASELA